MLADDLGDAAPETRGVGAFALLGDQQQHLHRLVGPVVADREQELQQPVLQRGAHARHHAQVDERDALVEEEDIARMRIGMEQAIAQHLLEVGAEQRIGQPFAVELEARERAQLGDLGAGDELHRQHARAGIGHDRLRDDDLGDRLQIVADGDEVQRLLAEVELAQHRLAELLEQERQPESPADLGVLVEKRRDLAERLEIIEHLLADSRALDLEGDCAAVA